MISKIKSQSEQQTRELQDSLETGRAALQKAEEKCEIEAKRSQELLTEKDKKLLEATQASMGSLMLKLFSTSKFKRFRLRLKRKRQSWRKRSKK